MNAARASGLNMPVVEIGYAPLSAVQQLSVCSDDSVIAVVRSFVVGITLIPPGMAAIVLAIVLIRGGL
jgi:hypothetical protein